MAPLLGQREELQEQEKRGGVRAEDDAPRDELAEKMARLGLHEPAEAAGEDSAAVDRFSPAFLRPHRAADQSALQPASIVRAAGPAAPSPMPDARRFAEGRLRRGGLARGPRNEPGAGTPAAARGVLLTGDHAYMTPPRHLHGMAANRQLQDPNLFSHVNEQAVLFALSQETPEKIVSYACDLLLSESTHGQQMFYLIFNHCHHQLREWVIAKITQDRSFYSLCVRRTNEVVFMINSCETRKSMQLFGDAMVPWMSPSQMRVLLSDSKRLQVIHAFIKSSPPDIAQFIFEAVAKECTRLARQSNGLSLLQNCLERVSWMEMDNILIKLSYQSLHLALNSCGNWILQDILKKGDSFHIAVIASCLRNHYVTLAKNKYGSNVVEWCLKVFNEGERSVIVNELIYYAHFRDLVTHEFANFTLSTALEVCKYPLRNILANAILSQNIMVRNQHCTKIFSILARYGFIQRTFLRDF
ncbi:putative pumilio homolog 8, chloroplastic [Setaria italica]|nr:putative pumilio homolog 8, chloroplastic [Setaria italica]XP_034580861.1 putative pumilio homolog 8, chloroplastic [Setaria viridis]TKW32903.1 hypothetical protein SEVIR_2G197500v2 [Setaria viridis]